MRIVRFDEEISIPLTRARAERGLPPADYWRPEIEHP
jgi:hypothetical protein